MRIIALGNQPGDNDDDQDREDTSPEALNLRGDELVVNRVLESLIAQEQIACGMASGGGFQGVRAAVRATFTIAMGIAHDRPELTNQILRALGHELAVRIGEDPDPDAYMLTIADVADKYITGNITPHPEEGQTSVRQRVTHRGLGKAQAMRYEIPRGFRRALKRTNLDPSR